MACSKKRLLLLLLIPWYCGVHFLLDWFLDYNFTNSDIVCFSAFIICASVILATHNKIARAVCLSLTHLSLVLLTFFESQLINLTAQDLLIYCIFELPSLLLFMMLTGKPKESIDEPLTQVDDNTPQPANQGMKRFFNYRNLYRAVMLVLLLILVLCFATGKERMIPANKFTTSLACFSGLLLISFFCFLVMYFHKEEFQGSEAKIYITRIFQTCLFYFLADIFWANAHNQNTAYLCLPLILSMIFVFKHFNVFANVKKVVLKKVGTEK